MLSLMWRVLILKKQGANQYQGRVSSPSQKLHAHGRKYGSLQIICIFLIGYEVCSKTIFRITLYILNIIIL